MRVRICTWTAKIHSVIASDTLCALYHLTKSDVPRQHRYEYDLNIYCFLLLSTEPRSYNTLHVA